MKRIAVFILLVIFISACSNEETDPIANEMSVEMADFEDSGTEEAELFSESMDSDAEEPVKSEEMVNSEKINRKVIYKAEIGVETDDLQEMSKHIQQEASELGGYIVESTFVHGEEEEETSGHMTVRIPQHHFYPFIDLVEEGSSRVIEQSISGEDVTEAFVDLESRLKSKRQVEERLEEFMENAAATEDLLKISSDLETVQEEIESLTGQMNYLEDKIDYSTVRIRIDERSVTLSSMQDDDLNTWEETKKQFMKSINFIITASSSLIVFLLGNIPLFFIIGIFILIGYLYWRKRKKGKVSEE